MGIDSHTFLTLNLWGLLFFDVLLLINVFEQVLGGILGYFV